MVGELGGMALDVEVKDFDVVVVLWEEVFVFFSFKTSGFVFEPREGDADVVVLVVDIVFLTSGDVGFLIG